MDPKRLLIVLGILWFTTQFSFAQGGLWLARGDIDRYFDEFKRDYPSSTKSKDQLSIYIYPTLDGKNFESSERYFREKFKRRNSISTYSGRTERGTRYIRVSANIISHRYSEPDRGGR